MTSKKDLYVKRCLTYLFMVFTVFTGVSESYTPSVAVKLNTVTLAYMLRLNEAFSQGNIVARIQAYTGSQSSALEYFKNLLTIGDNNINTAIAFFVVSMILISIIYYTNNCLKKNNIWKRAVF